ncbi:MAG: hypothetical protein ABSB77_07395 [Xanthobacteraceae bacterium]|jgi:hypothetical protein
MLEPETQMITPKGLALIAELIAAALLIIALTGFAICRSKPWFAFTATAIAVLIAAVAVLIDWST